MLANIYRLTDQKDFERVKERGKIVHLSIFSLAFYKREDRKPPRFGLVVSTKVSADAVRRNKIKRALREGVRQNLFYVKKGFDVIFLTKPEIARKYTDEIMREVREALKKAGLLR